MKNIFILLLVFMFSCEDKKERVFNDDNIDKSFFETVDDYILKNPLKIISEGTKNGYSYPSYHIYFYKKKKDTIMSVIVSSHLRLTDFEGVTQKDSSIFYKDLNPKKYLMYKKKYPLIIFEKNITLKSLILKEEPVSIPDSLKINTINNHIKFVKWDYKLENDKFQRIDDISSVIK